MSLAGGADSTVNNAINAMVTTWQVPVVVAAGNSHTSACAYSPASAAKALTVAATDSTDTLASFSNYGSCTDIAGPGVSILGAWYTGDSATNVISGTSMSTPLVAGVVALEMQRRAAANLTLNATAAMAQVLAMATASKISTPSGKLPLVYTNEGLVVVPAPPAPLPKPPPPPPPKVNAGPPPRRLGRQSSDGGDSVISAYVQWMAFIALVILF
jgi:serine protease